LVDVALAKWSSTIYGFYVIVGQIVAALAFVILISLFLASRGALAGASEAEPLHDYASSSSLSS